MDTVSTLTSLKKKTFITVCSLSVCCLSGLHDTPQAERRPHARRSPPQVAKPGYFHKMDLSRRFNHAFNYRTYGNQKNRASMLCMCMLNIYTRKTLTQHGKEVHRR